MTKLFVVLSVSGEFNFISNKIFNYVIPILKSYKLRIKAIGLMVKKPF